MRPHFSVQSLGLAFLLTGALAAAPAFAAYAQFFEGGGVGPTPEYALQAAIDDAQGTANFARYYDCEVVGDPLVYATAPGSNRAYAASVTLGCNA